MCEKIMRKVYEHPQTHEFESKTKQLKQHYTGRKCSSDTAQYTLSRNIELGKTTFT